MIRQPAWWDLAACGAAAGGAGVWGLAVAARVGWLRALLDLYPRSSWDQVTWVLIPVLMMLPLIAQGSAVAMVSGVRPVPYGRGIAGSVGGTLLVLLAEGAAAFVAAAAAAVVVGEGTARALPPLLILGCGVLLVAGAVAAAGRLRGSLGLRQAALPLGIAAAAAAWLFARATVLSASAVIDRAETAVFFIAVAAGGGVGSAWAVSRLRAGPGA